MTPPPVKPKNIDEYIAQFPIDVQEILEKLRQTIRESAPDAEEAISYQMPTFKLRGNLVHFAAYKKHIGFYPTPSAIEQYKDELSGYKTSKGAIQFPINEPVPYALVGAITKFRAQQNLQKNQK